MKVIITGATGMVGEGVLMECLSNLKIAEVLSVSRKPTGITHLKLKEYIVADFISLKEEDETLKGYDACFFCAGVSSVGIKKQEYTQKTYDTTMAFAKALSPKPQMTFCYISGAGTDSSEEGRLMWARVKGKTENDLMKLPFKQVFAFRPGALKYTEGQKRISNIIKIVSWVYPVLKTLFPNSANTVSQLGQAMIYAAQNGYKKNVVKVNDINFLVDKASK